MAQNVTRSVPMKMWFLRQPKAFRVPVATLQRQAQEGGRSLIHVAAKSLTMFLVEGWRQYSGMESLTANWLAVWTVFMVMQNPPHLQVILRNFEWTRTRTSSWSCNIHPKADDFSRAMKRRVYSTLRGMKPEVRQLPSMWIILINPSPDWSRMWNNVSQSYPQDGIKSTWYRWYMALLRRTLAP